MQHTQIGSVLFARQARQYCLASTILRRQDDCLAFFFMSRMIDIKSSTQLLLTNIHENLGSFFSLIRILSIFILKLSFNLLKIFYVTIDGHNIFSLLVFLKKYSRKMQKFLI